MSSARDQFIETTCTLLEAQGFHATGLNQIISESGAPKGSLYYYFPAGKDELAAEAIRVSGERVAARIRAHLEGAADLPQALGDFIRIIADQIEASGFRSGGPLMTIAMETATTNERLNLVCRAAYDGIVAAFAASLRAAGLTELRAAELAEFITASIEGSVILSRVGHSGDPLRRSAQELQRLLSREFRGG